VDVIGDGPERPARAARLGRLGPWGRRVPAVVAVLGLLGYVLTHRYPTPPPAGRTPGAAAAAQVGELTGRSGFGPAGLRVVLTGDPPRIIDLHTGRQQPVGELPDGVAGDGTSAATVRGGVIVYTSQLGWIDSYLVRPGRPTRLVVRDGVALPTWDGRGLVVVRLPWGTEPYSVTGQTLDGRLLWHWVAANHALVVRDTRYGLLVQDTDPPPDPQRLRLVRRETGQVLRRLQGTPVAVGGESVAYLQPGCGQHCVLRLTTLATGATRGYPVPVEPATGHGSFSPDCRWLAMTVPAGPAPGALPSQPSGLVVLDLRTGSTAGVPGLSVPPGESPILDWSADGRSLVVALRHGGGVRLGIWQPAAPTTPLTVLPLTYQADERTAVAALR
jgi:hypothetical protein